MTRKEKLVALYKQYDLNQEDAFKSPQGWTILTRSGIDKIQGSTNINIQYEVVEYTPAKSAAVKATATLNDATVETFGEAVYGKFPHGNSNTSYILAMAEKRAMSRAVLKLTGFYALGVFGEDESEDFKRPVKQTL